MASAKKNEKEDIFMVNFVIYEKDKELKELYVRIIKKFFYTKRENYKIYECDQYCSKYSKNDTPIGGSKIYLLDLDIADYDMCDFARSLRQDGDFISPIILLTQNNRKNLIDNLHNILYLDFLIIDENIVVSLLRSLKEAYRLVTRYDVYTFSAFDEIYRLLYDDIYLIEKNLNDDSVTIYTKDDSYLHFISIKGAENMLSADPRFFKTHRSCILNIYNVLSYDRKNNIVTFNNGLTTNLVSKSRRAKLAELLRDNKTVTPKNTDTKM